jgi:hypothetical protein
MKISEKTFNYNQRCKTQSTKDCIKILNNLKNNDLN